MPFQENKVLEDLTEGSIPYSKKIWYSWFPSYMCDIAFQLLEEEDSLLSTILTEQVVSKQ